MVRFMPQPLYPRYLLGRRLYGPQSRSGRYGEEKRDLNSNPSAVQPLDCRYTECTIRAACPQGGSASKGEEQSKMKRGEQRMSRPIRSKLVGSVSANCGVTANSR
jgi:hypothetical protein